MTIRGNVRELNNHRGRIERVIEKEPQGTCARMIDALIAVEEASNAVRSTLTASGFQALDDDRLRFLEATIYGYLLASNPAECDQITAGGFETTTGDPSQQRAKSEATPGRDLLNDVMNHVMEVWPMQYRPPSCSMVYWRWKRRYGMTPIWQLGYVTYAAGGDLLRMGSRNGDTNGDVVSVADIEWRPCR